MKQRKREERKLPQNSIGESIFKNGVQRKSERNERKREGESAEKWF